MTSATGRVVLAGTGEPVVGLGVSLCKVSTLNCRVVDVDTTDATGSFAVMTRTGNSRNPAFSLTVNDEPYDDLYTTNQQTVLGGHRNFGTIELERNEQP